MPVPMEAPTVMFWIAAEELGPSDHRRDIYQILGSLIYGNVKFLSQTLHVVLWYTHEPTGGDSSP